MSRLLPRTEFNAELIIFVVSFQDRVQQCFAEQIAGLSRGGAEVQFIIRVVAIPVNIASQACLALNMRSFASVLWASDVGLVATFSDEIEAMRTCVVVV